MVHRRPIVLHRLWRVEGDFLPFGGAVHNTDNVPDFERFECCPRDARLFEQIRNIRQATEFETPAYTAKLANLAGELLLLLNPRQIDGRSERIDARAPEIGGCVSA